MLAFFKQDTKTFELKINMTDTEIVVVENDTSMETAAIILKVHTVASFSKPKEDMFNMYP